MPRGETVFRRVLGKMATALAVGALALSGCSQQESWQTAQVAEADQLRYKYANLNIEHADVETPFDFETASTVAPASIDLENPEYWELRLEEAIQISLQNSQILRDLGGTVLRSPTGSRTTQDPSIVETDARFGTEAALSAFDAQLAASVFSEKNDRALNNTFFGGGTRILKQDTSVIQAQLSKKNAAGTTYIVRNNTVYDANNAPGNQVPSAWTTYMDAEVRQPLLFGGGVNFNRIAGGNPQAGLYTGVLIARINTDVSLADFEIGVRNYLSDVENAYWDLYFAYRDLDSKVAARDAALESWRRISPQVAAGRLPAEQEALAREQYYRLQEEAQNALTGKLIEGTRTNNGSSGGTFRGTSGVNLAERRLRLLMGISINDGHVIRPCDEPPKAQIVFQWEETLAEALTRRSELRRSKWLIKRRELELEASKSFLLPTLDAVGRYRWRGFGRDLWQYTDATDGRFDNAVDNMVKGGFQEWQLGAEFNMALGARKGHSAVRNAELLLARERTLLHEQERQVVLDLSNAIADMERSYSVVQTNYNRRIAARQQLEALTATEGYERDSAKLFVVLESQRRLADAENTYYRSLVEYALAVKNVHYEKGSLLEYNEVYMQEGGWPMKAYEDAEERWQLRTPPLNDIVDPILEGPEVVTQGETLPLILSDGEEVPASTEESGVPGDSLQQEEAPATNGTDVPSPDGQAGAEVDAPDVPPIQLPARAAPETPEDAIVDTVSREDPSDDAPPVSE